MLFKVIKYACVSAVGLAVVGGVIFGTDLYSYLSSSGRAVRSAVKDNVPVEFELRRARDLVDDLVPEVQACVRQIAQQEVDVAALRREIGQSGANLRAERARIGKLRDALATNETAFTFAGIRYTREQVKEDLARRFDLLKESEVVLAGKERLLQNRERSLAAAVQALERTRSQKVLLEGQIANLEAQHQLLQSTPGGGSAETGLGHGKLAQAERLIDQVKKQLQVAERVLAHEARFVQPIRVDAVSEKDLLTHVDEHLTARPDARSAGKDNDANDDE
jgi:hypothetical protein